MPADPHERSDGPTEAHREEVPLSKLIEHSLGKAIRQVPPLSAIGLFLARRALQYLAVATVAVLVYGAVVAVLVPALRSESVEAYKELAAQQQSHVLDILGLLIKDTALPVLMAILGYTFGARERLPGASKDEGEQEGE